MKKTLLATAISLTLASSVALACGQGQCRVPGIDGPNSVTSGAYTAVGGGIYSSATNNGASGGSMRSTAKAFNITGNVSKNYSGRRCGTTFGKVGTGAVSVGGTYTHSEGNLSGENVEGSNGAFALHHGSTEVHESIDQRLHLNAGSTASTFGTSNTAVDGTGEATMWTLSGAANISGAKGSKSSEYFRDWTYLGLGLHAYSRGTVDKGSMKGGTLGGAGSISGGKVEGDAEGSAYSDALATGYANGRIVTRGNAGQWSYANSGVNGTGIAGAGNYSGAGFNVSGKNVEGTTDLYWGHKWLGSGDLEINIAKASDWKVSKSGAFQHGDSYSHGEGAAWVGADAQAGDKYVAPEPQPEPTDD